MTEQGSNLTETGFSTTEILSSMVKLSWVGDRVRTFKPDSVMSIYVRDFIIVISLLVSVVNKLREPRGAEWVTHNEIMSEVEMRNSSFLLYHLLY